MMGFGRLAKLKPCVARTTTIPDAPMADGRMNGAGFTLIEIMVAISIVGLLACIAIPFYLHYLDRARVAVAVSEIKSLEAELYHYASFNGEFPETLSQIKSGIQRDPWGNKYQYLRIAGAPKKVMGSTRKDHFMVPVNSDFDLYSKGRDGASVSAFTAKSSQDDIVRAFNGGYCGKVADM